ncbi:MAG: rhodanese-like domain-containing protein [Acidobacteriota bacterium]
MPRVSAIFLFVASLLLAGDPWTAQDLVQPKDVAADIGTPLLLHVGFPVLYRSAHITGSRYAGPGSKAEGIETLKKAVAGQPKDREIVLYCGCCPWDKCPNMRPAFAALHALGYTHVKAMVIPENLKVDWIDKGYPTEKRAE